MFGVPVEWLLAAMSWETSQYKAYHAGNGGSAPHRSTNTSDAGGGLIGFTPFTPDQIRGSEMIEGTALWDKVDSGYVSDRSLAFE